MPTAIFLIVLIAAGLHAGWNAIVKGSRNNSHAMMLLVTSSATLLAAIVLPFLSAPARASWPFIAGSAGIHVVYFQLVARAYHAGDMGQSYPIMRGLAPLLVTLVGTSLLGEELSAGAIAGVVIMSAGILGMSLASRREHFKGIAYALANAVVIAGYTLVDGFGARRSGGPFSYTLWVFLLTGVPLALLAMRHERAMLGGFFRRHVLLGLAGGASTVLSYALVLWAMTVAPIAIVAALRETAILFGMAISVLLLKEPSHPTRIIAACAIALGAVILRIA